MTEPTHLEQDALRMRNAMVDGLAGDNLLDDPAWRAALETVPRHTFVPGFYLPGQKRDEHGLPVWEPVTADLDYGRWLSGVYADATLITQFDEDEPDWSRPTERHGGRPTSSSTLPSLVLRMWQDADLAEGQAVLEIGAGTGYSTALACERLGSAGVTSIEVDPHRLDQAAGALHSCGYTPTLAAADGLYGYWPEAPFDRVVAACSFRAVPPALPAQTRAGGKILLTLSGWLHGYARVLLTVDESGAASGYLLPGTISFMPARVHAPPAFGNPGHWAADLPGAGRRTRHPPERISAPTEEGHHLRFVAQSAVPDAQMTQHGEVTHLVDVVSGSAAALTPTDGGWEVRESGPVRLWERVESILDAYDDAGAPSVESFSLDVDGGGQRLRHPRMPDLLLPRP